MIKEMLSKRDNNRCLVESQLRERPAFALGMPNTLIIEPGAICPFKCPFCPQSSSDFGLTREFLKFNDFKKIVDYFEDFVDTILLFNWGEPLLNLYLPDMIAYAAERKIYTIVHSNLAFLTEELSEKLIKSGLSELVASIDGASEESYRIYQRGGSFRVAFENLKILINKKKEFKLSTPNIIWKFLVFRHNENEIDRARLLADELGVFIDFKFAVTQGDFESTLEEYNNRDFINKFIKNYDLPCKQLWKAPTICPNGDILPCCMISSKRYLIGNLFQQDFKDIWNNAKYQLLRKIVAGEVIPDDSLYCKLRIFSPNKNAF